MRKIRIREVGFFREKLTFSIILEFEWTGLHTRSDRKRVALVQRTGGNKSEFSSESRLKEQRTRKSGTPRSILLLEHISGLLTVLTRVSVNGYLLLK